MSGRIWDCGSRRCRTLRLALFLFLSAVLAPRLFAKTIPELAWEPRSDWINVKTDVIPAAKGDGQADDTAALQAALGLMRQNDTHGLTLYFPPGVYRITRSLVCTNSYFAGRWEGVALIGCGRKTTILWDGGATTHAMFWVKSGMALSRFTGIVWDGQNQAAMGIDHRSLSYGTQLIHKHEVFLNFTQCGIRSIHGPIATAEVDFESCLFQDCGIGIGLYLQNTLDFNIDGCEFIHCGYGIYNSTGGVYVRNCHFEGSTAMDLYLIAGSGCSVRRCTSVGSQQFIYRNWNNPLTVQECSVAGWQNANGAIVSDAAIPAPMLVMDCVFSQPPNSNPPVVAGESARVFLSGNTVEGSAPVYANMAGPNTYRIPGTPRVRLAPTQRFLKETATIPGRVFDAKRDFGAVGDGSADDTAAIQRTIDAARNHAQGALAYLPQGRYLITNTLSITGADYYVGGSGSGWKTDVRWNGAAGGVMFRIRDPDHVTLENISIGNNIQAAKTNAVDIEQTSSPGTPSFMTYDNVYVYTMYDATPRLKGLRFSNLSAGSTVLIKHLIGNLTFANSAQARILANAYYGGSVVVEGKDRRRQGLLGFNFLGSANGRPYALYVNDNQSLVCSDLYIESVDRYVRLTGSDDDPPGRVTIQGVKQHFLENPFITIENYGGQIHMGPGQFSHSPKPQIISQRGARPCDLLFAGDVWVATVPAYETGPSARVIRVGCFPWVTDAGLDPDGISDSFAGYSEDEVLGRIALAFDDLRRLGQLDLELNHPGIVQAAGIVIDTFSASDATALTNHAPDVNLPGGAYGLNGSGWPLTIVGNRASINSAIGGGISIESSGDYTKPSVLAISADLNVGTLTGSGWNHGVGLGFFGSLNALACVPYAGFTGLLLSTNGTLRLIVDGADSGQSVDYTGAFVVEADHALSYHVDRSAGSITNVVLDGAPCSFTTTAFTDAATAYAGFLGNADAGGKFSYTDNIKVVFAPRPGGSVMVLE